MQHEISVWHHYITETGQRLLRRTYRASLVQVLKDGEIRRYEATVTSEEAARAAIDGFITEVAIDCLPAVIDALEQALVAGEVSGTTPPEAKLELSQPEDEWGRYGLWWRGYVVCEEWSIELVRFDVQPNAEAFWVGMNLLLGNVEAIEEAARQRAFERWLEEAIARRR